MHKYTENQCIVNLLSGKLLTISKLQKGGLFRQTVVARGANPNCLPSNKILVRSEGASWFRFAT